MRAHELQIRRVIPPVHDGGFYRVILSLYGLNATAPLANRKVETDLRRWCEGNCNGHYHVSRFQSICFWKHEDLTKFMLSWSDSRAEN